MDEPETAVFGTNCLLARRLVERGVRFVELYAGSGQRLGRAHAISKATTRKRCRASDKPIAGLLADLKSRGMLKDTLVVWGGEFGRTPFNEKGNGRDHNPWGFTMWMAGGGVEGAASTSARPTRSACARSNGPCHVHDIHASILWLLGLDHISLTYMHNGRAERPTIVGRDADQRTLCMTFLPLLLRRSSSARPTRSWSSGCKRREPQAMAELYDRYGRLAYSLILPHRARSGDGGGPGAGDVSARLEPGAGFRCATVARSGPGCWRWRATAPSIICGRSTDAWRATPLELERHEIQRCSAISKARF